MPEGFSVFENQMDFLATTAAWNGGVAHKHVIMLLEAAMGDPVCIARVIDKGLEILPILAANRRNGWAARNVVATLARVVENDPERLAAIIDNGLKILPAVAMSKSMAAIDIAIVLAGVVIAHPELASRFVSKGLEVVPALVRCNGLAASNLVTMMMSVSGVEAEKGLVCQEFMVSARGGSGDRETLIVFNSPPESSVVATGRFLGDLRDLREAMNRKHPLGTPHCSHYERVLATAVHALAKREQLPSFRTLGSYHSALAVA